jgi:hypothetical protein
LDYANRILGFTYDFDYCDNKYFKKFVHGKIFYEKLKLFPFRYSGIYFYGGNPMKIIHGYNFDFRRLLKNPLVYYVEWDKNGKVKIHS